MIKIKNLSFSFDKKEVLKNINIEIGKKDSLLIAGRNGAGKTTLFRCINGIFGNYSGEIIFEDRKFLPEDRYRLGYLPSSLSFYDSMKIGETINYHKRIYPDFSFIRYPDFSFESDRRIEELSKGEKVLFYLLLILSHKPSYLFIDDVLHLLDPYLRENFVNLLIEKMEEEQLSVIINSQTFSDIEGLLVRLVILDKGEIIINEEIERLKSSFLKVIGEKIPDNLPIVYKKNWGDFEEAYVYPYEKKYSDNLKIESLKISEIIKSIIGGNYVKKRD